MFHLIVVYLIFLRKFEIGICRHYVEMRYKLCYLYWSTKRLYKIFLFEQIINKHILYHQETSDINKLHVT